MSTDEPALEEILIGAILLSPEQYPLVAALIRPDDFADPRCRTVYQAIRFLVTDGKPIDQVLLYGQLKADGDADEVGGVEGLAALTDAATGGENAKYYAECVAKESRKRKVVAAVQKANLALVENGDVTEVCGELRADLKEAEESDARRFEAKPIYKIAMDCLNPDTKKEQVSTGYPCLDVIHNGGIARGSLTVIGAAPSVGKTQLAVNLIHKMRCGQEKAKVLHVSMEMDEESMTKRLMAVISGVNVKTIGTFFDLTMNHRIREDYGAKFAEALDVLESMPFRMIYQSLSPDDLRAVAYRYSGRFDVMIVDYLQRCPGQKGQGIRERVEEASRACKDIAVEHNAAVIAIASLNRDGYKDTSARPEMSNLRESGNIEFDADNIWMLWRKKDTSLQVEEMELHIRKQRNGPLGTLLYEFDLQNCQIKELPTHQQPNF